MLAPTGKARVRLSQAMQAQGVDSTAKTVAQFLAESRRFDGYTMEYRLSEEEAQNVPFTVIIDESSMLTEEMFAALLQALRRNARRIIFVGDPNQLPPIGAGRPFVDLVRYLNNNVNEFPELAKDSGSLPLLCVSFLKTEVPEEIQSFPDGMQMIPEILTIVFLSGCRKGRLTVMFLLKAGRRRKNWSRKYLNRLPKKPVWRM